MLLEEWSDALITMHLFRCASRVLLRVMSTGWSYAFFHYSSKYKGKKASLLNFLCKGKRQTCWSCLVKTKGVWLLTSVTEARAQHSGASAFCSRFCLTSNLKHGSFLFLFLICVAWRAKWYLASVSGVARCLFNLYDLIIQAHMPRLMPEIKFWC